MGLVTAPTMYLPHHCLFRELREVNCSETCPRLLWLPGNFPRMHTVEGGGRGSSGAWHHLVFYCTITRIFLYLKKKEIASDK